MAERNELILGIGGLSPPYVLSVLAVAGSPSAWRSGAIPRAGA
ncbi:hypothetical protein ACIBHY_06440 [Nonomuraea sp. NPDC050547]